MIYFLNCHTDSGNVLGSKGKLMRKHIHLSLLLIIFLSSLTGCATAYLAGPLGYESVPIPPPLPKNGDPAEVTQDTYISLQGSIMDGFPVASFDCTVFAQAGISQSWTFPLREKSTFVLPVGISGWIGTSHVYSGAYQSGGLIPDNYGFYGFSIQIEPEYLMKSSNNFWTSFGLYGCYSYEMGDYSEFRNEIVDYSSSSHEYLNWSETPASLSIGPSIGLWWQFESQDTRLGDLIRFYYIIPTLDGQALKYKVIGISNTLIYQSGALGGYIKITWLPIFNIGLSLGGMLQIN